MANLITVDHFGNNTIEGAMMEIHIEKSKLIKESVDIDFLLHQISAGQAILFTGAGFSIGTTNIEGKGPPLAGELAKKICQLGGVAEDTDLRYAADVFLADNHETGKLISLLQNQYTLVDVSGTHESICKPNWRRFYTTNYDKSIEMAAGKAGRVVESIDLEDSTVEYYKRENLCVHLNGSIDRLTTDSLGNRFKLSASSYISADAFTTSDWYYYFKKDLERCTAIVFVGYSMYDIEVQKLLFEDSSLREHTYFITQEDANPKSIFTLSQFGQVLPIGVDAFASLINKNIEIFRHEDNEHIYQSLCKYELASETGDIRDSDVETFIMYGDIDSAYIDEGVISEQIIPYLVVREELNEIVKFTVSKQNTIAYSGLGNGKTVLLKEVKAALTLLSIDVFEVVDLDADYIGDFDALAKLKNHCVIVIDGYEPYIDLIQHYSLTIPKNINIIATARTAEHERLRPTLSNLGFDFNELGIDELSDNNASAFVDIVDNIGMWGREAGLSRNRKIDLLTSHGGIQLSLSLLSLFKAPQIRDRISASLSSLLRNPHHKETVFGIALIEILDIPAKYSLISEVAENDQIYSSSLRKSEDFKNLFRLSDKHVLPKSSLFSLFLIQNSFSPSYIVEQLLRIAKKFDSYKKKDYVQDKIFKATLRFSFVERLLPDANKKGNLRAYYEKLKVSVPWLKRDPHFWLQYGMANITFKEYGRAQAFIDQAYSLARSRENYYTSNIDTQQARLLILIAISETDASKVFPLFEKAHNLLSRLEEDVYKYRQVEKYLDFYNACFSGLSNKNKVSFIYGCKKFLNGMIFAESRGEIDTLSNHAIKKAKQNLTYIVNANSD